MKLNLRQARFGDHWKTVYKRKYPGRLNKITFSGLASIRDGSINLRGGISAIVGSNGVGKSTLLVAIGEVHGLEQLVLAHDLRLRGSELLASFDKDGGEDEYRIQQIADSRDGAGTGFQGELVWFDSWLALEHVRILRMENDLDSLLSTVLPVELDDDDLKTLGFLCNKEYSAGRIYEIPEYSNFERFPYFQVTSFHNTYGSMRMGAGEVSIFHLYWLLRYMQKGATVLVEEPESHISPRGQVALMNILSTYSAEEGVVFVVSTHSPTIIEKIPAESLIAIIADEGSSRVSQNVSKADVARILGDRATYKGALIVEDVGAQQFLSYLLAEMAPDLAASFEIIARSSESEITATLTNMPLTKPWLRILGCYDGNMRAVVTPKDHIWPHAFLPGDADPDELLKRVLMTTQLKDLHRRLQISEERLVMARNLITGGDLHDWPSQVAEFLSLPPGILRRSLVQLWLEDHSNEKIATEFVLDARSKLGASWDGNGPTEVGPFRFVAKP